MPIIETKPYVCLPTRCYDLSRTSGLFRWLRLFRWQNL